MSRNYKQNPSSQGLIPVCAPGPVALTGLQVLKSSVPRGNAENIQRTSRALWHRVPEVPPFSRTVAVFPEITDSR